jgi:vacuolar-type H+-ATPase subunit F/Vma7
MTAANILRLAVIGDEDLVNGLRLAGVSRYYVIPDNDSSAEEVRNAFSDLMQDAGVGIIALQEEYIVHVQDLIVKIKDSKRLTPIIVEVPSRYGTCYGDVCTYYKDYVRAFTGFAVEI